VRIVNYIAADDCGRIFNQKLVEGQLLGGMMQGIGQVFYEHIAYDPDLACPLGAQRIGG
jgi:aerobic carbon-monoxide dehydrogenase large subunit